MKQFVVAFLLFAFCGTIGTPNQSGNLAQIQGKWFQAKVIDISNQEIQYKSDSLSPYEIDIFSGFQWKQYLNQGAYVELRNWDCFWYYDTLCRTYSNSKFSWIVGLLSKSGDTETITRDSIAYCLVPYGNPAFPTAWPDSIVIANMDSVTASWPH